MKDTFEQIREQIHEIRNVMGPIDLKLADMAYRIANSKEFFEEKAAILESKLLAASFRMDKQDVKIAELTERVNRCERYYPK